MDSIQLSSFGPPVSGAPNGEKDIVFNTLSAAVELSNKIPLLTHFSHNICQHQNTSTTKTSHNNEI